ncbi:MAG: ATP-binding protein [Planctomycetia bacterium]
MSLARSIMSAVGDDLRDKMVFVGGPRQVGKTTLSLSLLGPQATAASPAYLTWDSLADREAILTGRLPDGGLWQGGKSLVILDELHKFAGWRTLVKGWFDKHRTTTAFLVTGSARLDYYRKGGDSLVGRFHYHRLHPLSLREAGADVTDLLRFGGFPEPFVKGQERFHRRWLREVSARILHDDLRDLERVREVTQLELLLHHLPACVGSPLSANSLGRLLQVSHASIERWLAMFERLYLVYRIEPFGARRIRAVRKERKLYFWDWSRVPEPGPRFENLVASHLLKYCHAVEDGEGHAMELRFIRDTDKREVDFVVLRDGRPEFAVECKTGDREPAPACRYFRERTDIPAFYQVHCGSRDYGDARSGTRVLPFARFCSELGLP